MLAASGVSMTIQLRPDFDAVVSSLYEAAAVSYSWGPALDGLARLTGSRGALITRPDRAHDGLACSESLEDTVAQFFEQGWHNDDLRSTRVMARAPQGGFSRDQDITTADERARSNYYEGFARAAGVPWFAACGLADSASVIGVSIQRTDAEGAFDDGDLERLRRISPHLESAMSFARNVADRSNAQDLDALEASATAAFVVDHEGVVRAMNARGEQEMSRLVTTRRRRLTALDPMLRTRFERLVAGAAMLARSASAPVQEGPLRLTAADGSVALASAMPLCGAARQLGDGRAIVTLTAISQTVGVDAAVLATAFDLTPAEARVAHHLTRGLDAPEIAEACSLSVGAVRFHLKAILPKAGVRRQAAFVALAASLGRI